MFKSRLFRIKNLFLLLIATFWIFQPVGLVLADTAWNIKVNITEFMSGVSGVVLTYSDVNGIKTAASDENGIAIFTVPNNWTGTITPSKDGYTFSPVSVTVNVAPHDSSSVYNFSASATSPTVTTLAATSVTKTSAILNGKVMGATDKVWFSLYYNGSLIGDYDAVPSTTSGSAETPVSYTLTGLQPDRHYSYSLYTLLGILSTSGQLSSFDTKQYFLSGMTLSSGGLKPGFATETYSYTQNVSNSTTSLTVTPTTANATSTVTVNGTTVTSGNASASIPLVVGNNTLSITVTTEDTATKTYTVTVKRAAGVAPVVTFGSNTFPTQDSTLASSITHITLEFSKDINGDGSTKAGNSTTNYLLFSDGGDGFQTVDCAHDVSPKDSNVPIFSAYYDDHEDAGPYMVNLMLNNDLAIPNGLYRLLVCGTTSIVDTAGNKLNNGADINLDFTIKAAKSPVATSLDQNGSEAQGESLPKSGFVPGFVFDLPMQPSTVRYDEAEMTLSIPAIDVEMPIVGVPKTASGWDVSWLGNNAGFLNGTAFPTSEGNSVITGHVWDASNNPGPFANLKKLQYGDLVQILNGGKSYTYEVRENKVISADNVNAVMKHENYSWVTLLTCEGYDSNQGNYDFRRIIRAVLVDVK